MCVRSVPATKLNLVQHAALEVGRLYAKGLCRLRVEVEVLEHLPERDRELRRAEVDECIAEICAGLCLPPTAHWHVDEIKGISEALKTDGFQHVSQRNTARNVTDHESGRFEALFHI